MDPMIPIGQRNTLAEYMILSGANNHPSMLDKDLYDYWKSRMELYMQNRENGRIILELVEHGPLIWPIIEENRVIRTMKYAELSATEKIQADCDIKAINIILQGLPIDIYSLVNHHRVAKDLWEKVQLLMQDTLLTKQERECKLYDAFDKFAHIKGESLHQYYLRFTQLMNDMNIYKMKLEQFQVNTKFLNSLPPEWSKFMTDVKLVKDFHTTNFDQLHAYLEQHELNANEVRLMRKRSQDPLALFSPSQSPPYGSTHPTQHYSTTYPSIPHAITYPSAPYPNLYSSTVYQEACPQPQSVPQIEYTISTVNQQTYLAELPQIDSGLAVLLRNSSNPRQQATIHDGRVTVQPLQGRQNSYAAGTLGTRANTSGIRENYLGQQRVVKCFNCQGEGHMERQCLKPKRKRDATWFRDKNGCSLQENEIHSDSNIISYSQYLIESQNVAVQDTNSSAQQDALILYVFKQLSHQEKEAKNIDTEIALEKKVKELDNIVYKMGQSLQTGHMLTKLQIFYDNNLKQALSFQNPFYLKKSQQISCTLPVKIEAPRELPKVSLFNTSLKKLKYHLGQFDNVVKKHITPNALTEGEWRFEYTKAVFQNEIIPLLKTLKDIFNVFDKDLLNEVTEVQTVFNQMEAAVQQYHVDKQCFEIQKKQFLIENDRLLDQIISQDIVNIVVNSSVDVNTSVKVNSSVVMNDSVNYVEMCNKCLELEAELIKQHNMVEKDEYNRLSKRFSELEQHCISLEIAMQLNKEIFQKNNTSVNQTEPSFNQLFELNNLKAELQAKDTTIEKLKANIKRLNKTSTTNNVKKDIDEIETINIELEHRVTKLIAENEHLKQTYKQLYDSIKPSRVRAKEQTESLVNQLNQKSVEITDLNAQLLKKVFVITTLKNDLRKFKGKDIVDNAAQVSNATTIAPGMYKLDPIILAPKVKNNREAHEYYLKHTIEEDAIHREVVEQAKSHNPLDSASYLACAKALFSVCDECLFDANHAMCLIDQVNSMNVHVKSVSKKNKKRKEWKPIGKVFNSTRYKWKPTRKTFTLVGNACPLTRITATKKMPLRVLIPLEVVAPKQVVTRVYTRRPKVPKSVQNSKPKVAKSITANRMEPNTSRGSDTLVAPSSFSLIDYRFSNMFCDLEVAFRKHTCFVRNLEGVDLLSGSRGTNLYSLSIRDMMASSPICLMSKATKTKSWLWHRRLSHLNFGAINHLARHGLVRGLPRLKFEKDHLCSACAMGKSKKQSHKPKSEDTNQEKLYLLHMDRCGPMRVASVNGKKYILVIVDDYSRFTWVKFLASKDEAHDFIIKFLKMIQVRLNATVRNIHTDNGTEFVNQTLRDYYEQVGISHETSIAQTLQQNGVVEWRNLTLVEATRTMLIFAKAPLFIWAEAIATACYT
ncbi:retrovirus-related pol polyprotein from transposon TNT 1-94 [Tanacetum coccineum]